MSHKLSARLDWVLSDIGRQLAENSDDPEERNCNCEELFKELNDREYPYDMDWIMCYRCGRIWVRKWQKAR